MTLIIWNNGISKIKMIKQYHIVQSGQTDSNIYLFIPSTWETPSTPTNTTQWPLQLFEKNRITDTKNTKDKAKVKGCYQKALHTKNNKNKKNAVTHYDLFIF